MTWEPSQDDIEALPKTALFLARTAAQGSAARAAAISTPRYRDGFARTTSPNQGRKMTGWKFDRASTRADATAANAASPHGAPRRAAGRNSAVSSVSSDVAR